VSIFFIVRRNQYVNKEYPPVKVEIGKEAINVLIVGAMLASIGGIIKYLLPLSCLLI